MEYQTVRVDAINLQLGDPREVTFLSDFGQKYIFWVKVVVFGPKNFWEETKVLVFTYRKTT